MASAAQILANQTNAQHSTGPRTEQGKAHSSQNRLSHGLSSKEFIVLPGQEADFDEFVAELHKAVQPAGGLELDLFTHLAHASWKLRRCRRAEVQVQLESERPDVDPALLPEAEARLRTIQIYAQRAERSYHKALRELKALQSVRLFKASPEFTRALAVPGADDTAPLAEPLNSVAPRLSVAKLLSKAESAAEEARAIAAMEAYMAVPQLRRIPDPATAGLGERSSDYPKRATSQAQSPDSRAHWAI